MKGDLAMHSRCLKQQIENDLEFAIVVFHGGTHIDERSARVGTYHGMRVAR